MKAFVRSTVIIFALFILALLFNLLYVDFAHGQTIDIADFSPGWQTRPSDAALPLGASRVAWNIDFSRYDKAICKRYGYDSVSAMTSGLADSIMNMYAAYYSDGSEQIFLITDTVGQGYGNIWMTNKGSSAIADDSLTLVSSHWGIQYPTSMTMFDDKVYFANGAQKGHVWNGDVLRSWPLKAPGEPTIVPLTSGSQLNGEYRYVFKYCRDLVGTCYSNASYISQPILVKNGQVLLKDFLWVGPDTITSTPDSISIYIYRTRGDQGRLDSRDSAFYIGHLIWESGPDSIAYPTLIDSIPDASLGVGFPLIEYNKVGRDSAGAYDSRYGAPTYISSTEDLLATNESMYHGGDSVDLYYGGLFWGIPRQKDTLGVVYTCTFIDTVTGLESDTSRTLWVFNDNPGSDSCTKYSNTIGLSRPPALDSGLIVNLYRAHMEQISHDSAFVGLDSTIAWREALTRFRLLPDWTKERIRRETGMERDKLIAYMVERGWLYTKTQKWYSSLAIDSIGLSPFYLVGQYDIASDSTITDSLRYDSLIYHDLFIQQTPPSRMKHIFSHGGRMYGLDESNLWYSNELLSIEENETWGVLNVVPVNRDDGDEGTLAFPRETDIRYFKNGSNYTIPILSDGTLGRPRLAGHFGCIAPESYASGLGGNYYLTEYGVVRETEGLFLENTYQLDTISNVLDNFDKLPIDKKENAFGIYHDQKYLLTIGDTTYVYDEIADAWSAWGITFKDAIHYGVDTEQKFRPGDSLYFLLRGTASNRERQLNIYGKSELDGETGAISYRWDSGEYPGLTGDKYRLGRLGIGIVSGDSSTAGAPSINFIDEYGTSQATLTLTRSDTARFFGWELGGQQSAYSWQIKITGTQNTGKFYTPENPLPVVIDKIFLDLIKSEQFLSR